MIISEAIINYRLFEGGTEALGTAEVNLPDISTITTEIEGAGIMGKYNSSITGHTEPMSMSLKFKNVTGDLYKLMTPETHTLEIRVSQQQFNKTKGASEYVGVKHIVKGVPTKIASGKVGPFTNADASGDYSVSYFATFIDGKKVLEIDIMNYIFYVNGKDYMEKIRKDLGV